MAERIMEWADKNQYNSFNPWKGLLYAPQYEELAKMKVPIPIQARIDPTLKCPLDCKWCNSARYRPNADELTTEHTANTLKFLAKWGVKAIVWAGGGEPTWHGGFRELLTLNAELGMQSAVLTNGVIHDPGVAADMGRLCRWVGVSVDAGNRETYTKLKGADGFHVACKSIRIMAENSDGCEVGYKFLITPDNQGELAEAAAVAKDLGATDFIARPMDTTHQGMVDSPYKTEDFDVGLILDQFEQCHALESPSFHVYTVTHKFNTDLSHSHDFKQCYGAPLRIHIATDGNVYFCDDQYYQPEYVIGSHLPDPTDILSFWGKGRHLELLYGCTPKTCTTRCCVGDYCRQCERLFVDGGDPICRNYP